MSPVGGREAGTVLSGASGERAEDEEEEETAFEEEELSTLLDEDAARR